MTENEFNIVYYRGNEMTEYELLQARVLRLEELMDKLLKELEGK